jgi:hypothetical protein
VRFDGVTTAFTVISDTQISATIPDGALTGPISITTPAAVAWTPNFKVKPKITTFSPTSGPVGTKVKITGSAFTGATKVAFNGKTATFTVNSYTQITATVPTGATTGAIAITTPGGTSQSSKNFSVT